MHGIGKINPETGLPFEVSGRIWTDEFNDEMVQLGGERGDVVALTAAMLIPVGLDGFAAHIGRNPQLVGVAAAVHLLAVVPWLTVIRRSWVRQQADTCAERLLEALEHSESSAGSTTP